MRITAWASAVVAIVLAVLFVTLVVLRPAPPKPIESIQFHQSQAEPNFEDGQHTVTDRARIAQFRALVVKYSIDLGNFNAALNDECTGGLATNITVTFTDSSSDKIVIYDCSGTVARGTFVSDATALFSEWRGDSAGQ